MIRYDLPMKTDVSSRKPPIAKPYAAKKPHVFFLHGIRGGREVAELAERMDITWDTTAYDRAWDINKWGFGDFYDVRAAIWDFTIVNANLQAQVTSDKWFDCMVINCANGFAAFTPEARAAILRRVREGAGLLLIQPFDGADHAPTEELAALSPLVALYQEGFTPGGYPDIAFDAMIKGQPWLAEAHPITHGIPFETLACDVLACYPYEAAGDVIVKTQDGHPVGAVRQVGKGRVAAFGYYPRTFLPQHKDFTGMDACFNPIMDDWKGALDGKDFDSLEYFYRMIARAILWCSGCEPQEAAILGADLSDGTLRVETSGEHTALYAQVKNAYDDVVLPMQRVTPGQSLADSLRGGGVFRCDLQLRQGEKVADFYTAACVRPAAMRVEDMRPHADVLVSGDTLTCTCRVEGGQGEAVVALEDGIGRVLAEQRVMLSGEPFDVSFPLEDILSINVFVTLAVYDGDLPILRGRSKHVIVTPQKRDLDDFEVWMNPQNRGHGDMLPYVNRLFPQIGMTGNLVGHNKLVAMSGGEGLGVYWYNRGPYVENKEKYLRTRDKQYLKRTPCLNDPAFWAENARNIEENVTRNRKYGPVAYFAQDEGSLTCYTDALEFCFCDNCMQKMRAWLQTVYPSLEALNRSWNMAFAAWDDVVPYTTQEARSTGDFASWGDHRRFMELSYAGSYEMFAKLIGRHDPQGRVRMSGCQASTAYSGNDYDLLHEVVRYFEAYPVGNQYEFHRSFKRPETILGGWFGYGAQGKSVQNRIWYALYHGLTLISIFWEYACLNYDYTFSNSALAMGEAYREIRREGIGKLLLYAAQQDALGIAVHYSMASVHGTQIIGRQDVFVENRQGWLNILEDMGYQYNFVSARRIEAGELARYRVLILPYSIAIGAEEAERIRAFARGGGLVVADVQAGLMDEHCKLGEAGALDDLFGIERLSTEWEPFYINREFENSASFPHTFASRALEAGEEHDFGTLIAEAGTRLKTGACAFVDVFMQRIPVVAVNGYGTGHGVYLNIPLKDYTKSRAGAQGAAQRAILRDVLSLAGIQKPVTLLGADGSLLETDVETFYYRYGAGGHIVAVQRAFSKAATVKYDGLAKAQDGAAGDTQEPFAVRLDGTYHVYGVRAKEYLGYTDCVQDSMAAGDSRIYALLPYRAERMDLALEGNEIVAVLQVDGALEAPCAFSMAVMEPNGTYSTLYSQNLLAPDGTLRCAIPFALSDPKGTWTVSVKDVATGVSAEIALTR